jgi:hypothetical protein
MTSMGATEASDMPASGIVGAWKEGLAPVDHVHHHVGNYLVTIEGDTAAVFCYGTATHYKEDAVGGNVRTFVGSYDLDLVKSDKCSWNISGFKFSLKYIDGNRNL